MQQLFDSEIFQRLSKLQYCEMKLRRQQVHWLYWGIEIQGDAMEKSIKFLFMLAAAIVLVNFKIKFINSMMCSLDRFQLLCKTAF
jgi:hypothetical protein